jgi:group I intron endonuclease
MGYVYKVINEINGKYYIGSSKLSPNENKSYYGSGKAINDALKKYGKSNFTKVILAKTEGEAKTLETFILHDINAASDPLSYNMTNNALGSTFHSENGRKSKSQKLTGRKMTPEQRSNVSKNKTGIKFPDGYKTRKDKGKPRISTQGRTSPNRGKGKKINLYIASTHEYLSTYNNTVELGNYLSINPETIRQCLIGKQQTICNKQYYVKYLEEQNVIQ